MLKIARAVFNKLRNICIRAIVDKKCMYGDKCNFYPSSNIINLQKNKGKIRLGDNCHIKGELLVFPQGGDIALGDYCYVGSNTYIWAAGNIKIGDRVLISHNCNIFDNDTHPLDPKKRHEQFMKIITTGHPKEIDLLEEDVIIDDDVLIAANSIILKGVRIGKGAVVGAGSVVTRDVPPLTVVAGNPARVVKRLEFGAADEH